MPDLILWALEECVKGGPDKCTYRYLQAILDRCRESKITARNQAEADRKHRAGQQVPSDPKKQAAEDAKLRKWMAEQGISENGVEVKPAG
jgi:DNA replication protein DnaD